MPEDDMSDEPEIVLPSNPITPTKLDLDNDFQFACHPGVSCFNKCCQSIDIQLTPYDILRLKARLGITAREFLFRYTVPFEMDGQGVPGLKLKTRDETTACSFLTDEGCSVYSDRPTACRYYALGVVSMRKKDSPVDEDFYFVVKEEHCQGHAEPKTQTVREYRQAQGVESYDELNREWRQLVLKKRSCGPVVGKPSDRSLQLFFLASYDLDGLREFLQSPSFQEAYEIDAAMQEQLRTDDVALMQFGFRFLKHVLFGEKFLTEKPDALERRVARRRAREEAEQKAAGT